jgi:hypothetical protein
MRCVKITEYKLYIPKFFNEKFLGIIQKPTNRKILYSKILEFFNGFTIFENNKGFYKENLTDKKIYKDDIEIIQILANKKDRSKIENISRFVKIEFKQKSVIYTIDNSLREV